MAEQRSPLTTVQELIINDKELPKEYIYKGSDAESLGVPLPLADIPEIDIGILRSASCYREEELDKLRSSLSSWGCFQAINHGIEAEFLDKVFQVMEQFFALPPEKKQKWSREDGNMEGYGNDMIISEHQTLDWTDRLFLTVSPEDQRQLKFWPQDPPTLREVLHEYTMELKKMTPVLLTAMARSLHLEDNVFIDMYGERGTMVARFNFYPPCPRPDQVVGVKPHADGSAFTFLMQDKHVEGLQVLKGNQWYSVSIIPQAILVNLGDVGEIMSNGIFKSPMHRVVTNPVRKRISLAVFCLADPEKEIEPVKALVSDSRPRLYKTVKDYASIYFQYYQLGRRPIEAAMIY